MTNNDILRRLRYTLRLDDAAVARIFGLGGQAATRDEVDAWTRPDDDPALEPMTDYALATFLNGLIVERRGPREDGRPLPPPERELSNNAVLRKLKIAFDLKTHELRALFALVGKQISEAELTAFFRRPGTRQFRVLNDQYLRQFLSGLQASFRGR